MISSYSATEKRIELDNYHMVPVDYEVNGQTVKKYGVNFTIAAPTVGNVLKYSFYNCLDFVRMVRAGLVQLFTGQASMSDMTGVVGMVDIINETGQSAQSTSEGIANVVFLVAFIAVNLAVMNLLPLPALDGGPYPDAPFELRSLRRSPGKSPTRALKDISITSACCSCSG